MQDQFALLDKKTNFNNRVTLIYLATIAITIFVADILLFTINPNSLGLLIVLNFLLLVTGFLIIKQKSLMNSALTEQTNLTEGLINLAKIARKYPRSKK